MHYIGAIIFCFRRNNYSIYKDLIFITTFTTLTLLSCNKKTNETLPSNINRNPGQGLWDVNQHRRATFNKTLTLGVAEGDENQQFFKAADIAVDDQGNMYVLDTGNARIQVFDRSGAFQFSFGRFGKGPGEFSRRAHVLKFLDDGYLYLIDNDYQRITIFAVDGKYLDSFKVEENLDDVIIGKHGGLFFSNFVLSRNHKPIHRNLGSEHDFETSFGAICDPGEDLITMTNNSPYGDEYVMSDFKMTNLAQDSDGNIYYSQRNPYLISKYSSDGDLLLQFNRRVRFTTLFPLTIEILDDGVRKTLGEYKPHIGRVAILEKDIIAVPVFSPKKDLNFIDFYNTDGQLLSAAPLPIQHELFGPTTYIISTTFDSENNFYCLYTSPEKFPKLVRYSIKFESF